MDAARQIETTPLRELTDRDREIIAFERQWWKYAGAKEQAIKDLFDLSATRYYQVLNALIDRPEALAFDPLLVRRLRRLRGPRHANSSLGVQALSRREHEIVRLAVAGQSNPTIARHLFLSERTIETHLRNAYTKLDVNSRLELTRRAAELDI